MTDRVEDLNSFQQLIESENKVLVKFEADWCGPCKAMQPLFEEVASQYDDAKFVVVDIEGDRIDEILAEYGVRSVPAFVRVESGNPQGVRSGTMSKKELSQFIQE